MLLVACHYGRLCGVLYQCVHPHAADLQNMKQCMLHEILYIATHVATQLVHKSTQLSTWREMLLYLFTLHNMSQLSD